MLIFVIFILVLSSVTLLSLVSLPFFTKHYEDKTKRKAQIVSGALEQMFIWVGHNKLVLILGLTPIILGIVAFILFGKSVMILAGFALGFVLPTLVIKQLEKRRKRKFQTQLLDALSNLSQSLKAGLSFIQALEVLVEETSPPISQEIALVLKENKMGVTLEDSFERLNKKMDLEELNLITTAILVARETGGNLTEVFSHLAESIRQRNRIIEQVKTLTTQARWQGMIMSALPIVFAIVVFNINPGFFDMMLNNDKGRLLLFWCVISELIGAFILRQLSRVEV